MQAKSWSTSLVVCAEVAEWQDFPTFDRWVSNSLQDLEELVGLVVFHPRFSRWPSLPAEMVEGSRVMAFYQECDGRRSRRALPATVESLDETRVGTRRVGVRFLDDGVVQWVPIEWLKDLDPAPKVDNVLHQAPHPTVHLIRRADLDAVKASYDDVAKLLARNASYLRSLEDLEDTQRQAAGLRSSAGSESIAGSADSHSAAPQCTR